MQIVRKRPREGDEKACGLSRDLVERIIEQMLDDRFSELARKPDAKFLGAGAGNGSISQDVDDVYRWAPGCRTARSRTGWRALAVEAKRARDFGFSASELDRAKKWMAAVYERAYSERDKTESGSFAQEYLEHFLKDEPSPGIAYEYQLVQTAAADDHASEVTHRRWRGSLPGEGNRVMLATSPQKARHQASDRSRRSAASPRQRNDAGDPVGRHGRHARADGEPPEPAASRRGDSWTTWA